MKKNLLYGILGGAAVGAAASYLMSSSNRGNLGSGLKNIGDSVTNLLGSSEELLSNVTGNTSSKSSKSTTPSTGKSGKSSASSTSRRG